MEELRGAGALLGMVRPGKDTGASSSRGAQDWGEGELRAPGYEEAESAETKPQGRVSLEHSTDLGTG